jgi:hypothetical protein
MNSWWSRMGICVQILKFWFDDDGGMIEKVGICEEQWFQDWKAVWAQVNL